MSTKASYLKIGVFVICTVIILVAGTIVLSAGVLKRDTLLLETYVIESVQGLSVGSPVMRNGVQIGRVKEITFVTHVPEYGQTYGMEGFDTYSKYVMLVMVIDKSTFLPVLENEQIRDIVERWVQNGLRLKLSYQGITGIAYVEADFDMGRYPPMEIGWEPKYIYIPSAPSMFISFTQSIDRVFQRIDSIKFEEISESLKTTLDSIGTALKDAQIPKLRKDLSGLIADLRKTNRVVMELMEESKGDGSQASIPETITQLNTTLEHLDRFVLSQQSELEEIVTNVKRLSANLLELTANLKKYPGQLLLSSPPPKSEVMK